MEAERKHKFAFKSYAKQIDMLLFDIDFLRNI